MRSLVIRLAFILVPLMMFSGASSAAVLNFEDLNPAPSSFDVMPATYGGFTFSGWYFGPDTVYAPASGTIDLFTNYADPNDPFAYVVTDMNNAINSATAFYFDGAYFSGYSGVTFELYLGGSLVATSATLPDAAGVDPYLPTFLASGYSGLVDKIVVSGVQGYYSMDDFTYHVESATTIPEPSTGMLAGLALLVTGAAGARRPKRRR